MIVSTDFVCFYFNAGYTKFAERKFTRTTLLSENMYLLERRSLYTPRFLKLFPLRCNRNAQQQIRDKEFIKITKNAIGTANRVFRYNVLNFTSKLQYYALKYIKRPKTKILNSI